VLTASEAYSDSSIQKTPSYLAIRPQDHRRIDPVEEMSKPVLFYGKPSQLDDVLTFADIKNLTDGNHTDESQCGLLASLFRGQALHWLTALLKQKPEVLKDYAKFKVQLTTAFGVSDDVRKSQAAQRLNTCSQRGPVQLYAIEMRQLFQTLGCDDATSRAYFKKGLKLHVREALIASGEQDSLNELIEEAARIDTELYAAKRPQRGGQRAGRQGPAGGVKCHSCGKFGHVSRNCRKKEIKTEQW
jgi:hypothetical protein